MQLETEGFLSSFPKREQVEKAFRYVTFHYVKLYTFFGMFIVAALGVLFTPLFFVGIGLLPICLLLHTIQLLLEKRALVINPFNAGSTRWYVGGKFYYVCSLFVSCGGFILISGILVFVLLLFPPF